MHAVFVHWEPRGLGSPSGLMLCAQRKDSIATRPVCDLYPGRHLPMQSWEVLMDEARQLGRKLTRDEVEVLIEPYVFAEALRA